ncbi:hypothetical protein [Dokdonella sp.]|uniref:hypothetical protein n=1 Tax=Dokdonella sp. TaxID=2291710 RepID=UPI002F3FADCA
MPLRTSSAFRSAARDRCVVAIAALGLVTCGIATAQVVANVIAGGGGISHSAGGCRTLEGSLGETATGMSSGAGYSVHAGYWAGAGSARRDSLFRNGFEECR